MKRIIIISTALFVSASAVGIVSYVQFQQNHPGNLYSKQETKEELKPFENSNEKFAFKKEIVLSVEKENAETKKSLKPAIQKSKSSNSNVLHSKQSKVSKRKPRMQDIDLKSFSRGEIEEPQFAEPVSTEVVTEE